VRFPIAQDGKVDSASIEGRHPGNRSINEAHHVVQLKPRTLKCVYGPSEHHEMEDQPIRWYTICYRATISPLPLPRKMTAGNCHDATPSCKNDNHVMIRKSHDGFLTFFFTSVRAYRFCFSTAMSALFDDGLRQRVPPHREEKAQAPQALESDDSTRDHVVWGKTPSGQGVHRTRCPFR